VIIICRLGIIDKNFKDQKFLTELITELNEAAGGDGIGIGWFEAGTPYIFKGIDITPIQIAEKICSITSDHGIIIHVRRASVGIINDKNCHPFLHNNEITMHNGHIESIGILKLMMLEQLEKYKPDGWTQESIMSTPDSDIMAYFISKRGFGMASMLTDGTVLTMNSTDIKIWNGYQFQAVAVKGSWIYASTFTPTIGLMADQWIVCEKGTELSININGEVTMHRGNVFDGKLAWAELQKKNKKNKKDKYN